MRAPAWSKLTPAMMRRAFWVALIVGTVLNLVNQGEALMGVGHINWGKALLTYLAPLLVSLHGAGARTLQSPET